MPKAKSSVEIKNRRASFDYEFIETFQAGMVLTGTEIKSIRAGKASLLDAYCYFNNNELYVKNMHVAEYSLHQVLCSESCLSFNRIKSYSDLKPGK